jgi:hypothetical protein
MMVIRDSYTFNLDDLSKMLSVVGIPKLNIICISRDITPNNINYIKSNIKSTVTYVEFTPEQYRYSLNNETINNFLSFNKDTIYILKDGTFTDIKNIFTSIEDCKINLSRSKSQKSHILSPLDLRLSIYILAMFNFNYNLINKLNEYNDIEKRRYLGSLDYYCKHVNIDEDI